MLQRSHVMMNNNMNFEVAQSSSCDTSPSKLSSSPVQYIEPELNCFFKKEKAMQIFYTILLKLNFMKYVFVPQQSRIILFSIGPLFIHYLAQFFYYFQ